MMKQELVINQKFFKALSKTDNATILSNRGYKTPDEFINGIINKLNAEFSYLEIDSYRLANSQEEVSLSQYSAFVEGDDLSYKRIVVFFTPIISKLGNVIIEQSLMPTICKQMEKDITFLFDDDYKKILVLTSQINRDNEVKINYNKLQMDVNSLNTLNFDVIQLFKIKNLSTDTRFNSLTEYLDMSEYLQKTGSSNEQYRYLDIKNNILYGDCMIDQLQGEFHKSFCFRFLTAMFAGRDNYTYNIDKIINKVPKLDNQFKNLVNFINYINNNTSILSQKSFEENIIESDDDIENINDIHRKPIRGIDNKGRKRYKTQKKIRDSVLEKAKFLCNCDDSKHYYFESVNLHNYVEGHHVIPMNRQEEYYFDRAVNLDIPFNIIPLCPNCHCQIHLGSRNARIKILSEIYIRNKEKLQQINPQLTLTVLASYYNIGLDQTEELQWLNYASRIIEEKESM